MHYNKRRRGGVEEKENRGREEEKYVRIEEM
jgi:hypothetical protein